MNENIIGIIINIVFCLVGIVIFSGISIRVFRDKLSAVKSVKATVIDKQTDLQKKYFKSQARQTEQKYIVTFISDKKKISFYVSAFSYNGYKINQTGILKYRGTKIIDFK